MLVRLYCEKPPWNREVGTTTVPDSASETVKAPAGMPVRLADACDRYDVIPVALPSTTTVGAVRLKVPPPSKPPAKIEPPSSTLAWLGWFWPSGECGATLYWFWSPCVVGVLHWPRVPKLYVVSATLPPLPIGRPSAPVLSAPLIPT